jgi:hypothetical protein
MSTTQDPRYPIGRFVLPLAVTEHERRAWLEDLRTAPALLRAAVSGLSDAQLDTPYRDGGWTVRQVTHHVPDSHVNAYVRVKLALTEPNPTIKPYDEGAWATLADAKAQLALSLQLLDVVHAKLLLVLAELTEQDWKRSFFHPAKNATQTIEQTIALYAWHGKHHAAHVTSLRQRKGW